MEPPQADRILLKVVLVIGGALLLWLLVSLLILALG